MNSYTVVILSKTLSNVKACVESLRAKGFQGNVIVVADGIETPPLPGVTWLPGIKPFCFARNANIGIMHASTDDVILCNDDCTLLSPYGFDKLQAAAQTYGIVSATVSGRCGNERQKQLQPYVRTEPETLAFVCVYIPRSTLNKIGLLDESFTTGTYEDNDYCSRAKLAGLLLGICGGCVVEHPFQKCTLEKQNSYRDLLRANKAIYEAKWSPLRTVLSICICSIFSRKHYLDNLMARLGPQLGNQVELLLSVDGGALSIGQKRQKLLEQASGEFIVYIDDDDLVASDYVSRILTVIHRNPKTDAVTFYSRRYVDGVFDGNCKYSITCPSTVEYAYIDGIKCYYRYPFHVTPIRRSLALQVGFKSLDHGEDSAYAVGVRPLIKEEEFIPEYLYEYYYRLQRIGEKTHRNQSPPSI